MSSTVLPARGDMRVVVKVATIPAPEKKGDWTPHNAEFRVFYDEEFE